MVCTFVRVDMHQLRKKCMCMYMYMYVSTCRWSIDYCRLLHVNTFDFFAMLYSQTPCHIQLTVCFELLTNMINGIWRHSDVYDISAGTCWVRRRGWSSVRTPARPVIPLSQESTTGSATTATGSTRNWPTTAGRESIESVRSVWHHAQTYAGLNMYNVCTRCHHVVVN